MDMFYKPTRIHLNPFFSLKCLRNQKIVNRVQKKSYNKIHQIKIDEASTEEKIKILKGFGFELKVFFETTNIFQITFSSICDGKKFVEGEAKKIIKIETATRHAKMDLHLRLQHRLVELAVNCE